MNSSVVLGQCLAMRAQLDALIAALVEEHEPAKMICLHPEKDRRYDGTMGNITSFKCLRCEQVVESREHPHPVS